MKKSELKRVCHSLREELTEVKTELYLLQKLADNATKERDGKTPPSIFTKKYLNLLKEYDKKVEECSKLLDENADLKYKEDVLNENNRKLAATLNFIDTAHCPTSESKPEATTKNSLMALSIFEDIEKVLAVKKAKYLKKLKANDCEKDEIKENIVSLLLKPDVLINEWQIDAPKFIDVSTVSDYGRKEYIPTNDGAFILTIKYFMK